jgi:uncharacterized protein (TIGR03084 family)
VSQLDGVISDLNAEGDDLYRLLAGLDESQWALPTPAPGWTIAHQVAHLTAIFHMAGLSAADPDGFRALAASLSDDFDANVDAALARFIGLPRETLLAVWRGTVTSASGSLAVVPADQVVPWLVRPLPPAVLAAAGLMELFGHGQDIADALGVRLERGDRIKPLVGFAVRVWDFGYLARGLSAPDVEFRFELASPSGELWAFGPEDAEQRVTGSALDFCLLVTRRRHRDDLDLVAIGPDADHWLDIAQAYRGPAGQGRRPGQFATARV